jgi:hypothetical protein
MNKPFAKILIPVITQYVLAGMVIPYVHWEFSLLSVQQIKGEMTFNAIIIPLIALVMGKIREDLPTGKLLMSGLFCTAGINLSANVLLLLL